MIKSLTLAQLSVSPVAHSQFISRQGVLYSASIGRQIFRFPIFRKDEHFDGIKHVNNRLGNKFNRMRMDGSYTKDVVFLDYSTLARI